MKYFKLNHSVVLDWYRFKANTWHLLGGEFLCTSHDNPEGLETLLKDELPNYSDNPEFEEIKIEYK